jgi:putative protease
VNESATPAAARRLARLPEVLAPAGAPDCLPAAVAGGADAVFLGLRHFNARGRAENFRKAELPRQVAYLHRHGLKCYVVMNTLVHDDEYPKALDLAGAAQQAGVDAVIIQDLGLWRALTRAYPDLRRHASTQMTVHDPSQIAVLAELGAERVILARELSLPEVAACTAAAHALGLETEHFAHGALCYAFSGQCLMSNFAGCRSANRGTCAQNCRFDYQRGEGVGVGAGAAVDTEISMKDLALVAEVGALCAAGVSSLKIEGRLKGPDYVYTTSRVYRAAVDAWAAGRGLDLAAARDLLKDVFARPLTAAPLLGDYSSASRMHRYDPAGDHAPDAELVSCDRVRGELVLRSRSRIAAGQGYAFSVGFFNGGFLVIAAEPLAPERWRCRVRIASHGPRLSAGLALFRNADHERKREAAAAMAQVPLAPERAVTTMVALNVSGRIGAPLTLTARCADGRQATVCGTTSAQRASAQPLDEALCRAKLGALGGTAYHLGTITLSIEDGMFLPAAELKALRRELVAQLDALPPPPGAPPEAAAPASPAGPPAQAAPAAALRRRDTRLWVAVGSLTHARAALDAGATRVWLDDPTLELWGAAPPRLERGGFPPGTLWLRHPATAALSPHLAALGLPLVAGHLGVLHAARELGLPAVADLFCNVFSSETLLALGALGAEAAVISLECSSREIARLATRLGALAMSAPGLAIVAHGRLPAMLTRQDHGLAVGEVVPLRATAADGGLPYQLQRRRHGDTVVWEGRRLCAPAAVAATLGLVDAWVLELGDLDARQVAEVVGAYRRVCAGEDAGAAIRDIAERAAPAGLFSGHLEQGSRELDQAQERLAEAGLPE